MEVRNRDDYRLGSYLIRNEIGNDALASAAGQLRTTTLVGAEMHYRLFDHGLLPVEAAMLVMRPLIEYPPPLPDRQMCPLRAPGLVGNHRARLSEARAGKQHAFDEIRRASTVRPCRSLRMLAATGR